MIQAVIFDMDGLLIDSEPIWKEAEVLVFTKVGVPLTLDMTVQTMGLRSDEAVEYWFRKYPWVSPSQQEVCKELDATVMRLIEEKVQAMDGVNEAIEVCASAGLPIAIASSSSMVLIEAAVRKLGIKDKITLLRSAYDEPYGKPHPAVYIRAAEDLGVHPNHCLAFEDSVNGVLSAKAAKMKCIAIPEPGDREDKRFGIADLVLDSLRDFTPKTLEVL